MTPNKVIQVTPGLSLEVDYHASDEPILCLRATDVPDDDQHILISWDELPYVIEALQRAMNEAGQQPASSSRGRGIE